MWEMLKYYIVNGGVYQTLYGIKSGTRECRMQELVCDKEISRALRRSFFRKQQRFTKGYKLKKK